MALPVYITPTEMFRLAPLGQIQRAEIPGPQYAGKVSVVVPDGGNASVGTVFAGGYSIDVGSFAVRVQTGGDIGTAIFQFSDDGGLTYGSPQLSAINPTVPGNRYIYEIGGSGVLASMFNGGSSPSFVAGDFWTFTSEASALCLNVCDAASRLWAKHAQNSVGNINGGNDTILTADAADKLLMANWARVQLCAGRGKVEEDWWKLYLESKKIFESEAKGDLKLFGTPDPDTFVFPDRETARRPFGTFWRF